MNDTLNSFQDERHLTAVQRKAAHERLARKREQIDRKYRQNTDLDDEEILHALHLNLATLSHWLRAKPDGNLPTTLEAATRLLEENKFNGAKAAEGVNFIRAELEASLEWIALFETGILVLAKEHNHD